MADSVLTLLLDELKLILSDSDYSKLDKDCNNLLRILIEEKFKQGNLIHLTYELRQKLQSLAQSNPRATDILSELILQYKKYIQTQITALTIGKSLNQYSINQGDKDLKYYFFAHLPEDISETELDRRLAKVNGCFGIKLMRMLRRKKGNIFWQDLSDEEKYGLILYSQILISSEEKGKKCHSPEEWRQIRKVEFERIKKLRDSMKEKERELLSLGSDVDISIRNPIQKNLSELREKYDRGVVSIEQEIKLLDSYVAHFQRESRWRIISAFDHVQNGRLYWFGTPAQGTWIWVITQDGEFNFANRQPSLQGGFHERIPHATIAMGKRVLGSGEALFKDGFVQAYNAMSGHYFDASNPIAWSDQVKFIFKEISTKTGLAGTFEFVMHEFENN